jgi:solute:Na+ symporter, SSS family
MIEHIKHVNQLDFIVIGVYIVMLTVVGVYLTRFNRTSDDFFKGGGKIPWWIAGLSTFVSGFSAFMFVAAAGYTYANGLPAVIMFTSAFWGYWLGYYVYAKRWSRARLSSPMEFLTRRYSQSTTYYYTLLSIVPAVLGLGLSIYILCIFIATALGITSMEFNILFVTLNGLEFTIVVAGLVLLIYTSAGGLWAVVITDVLQFIVIVIITILIFPLSFAALGAGEGILAGMRTLVTDSPPGYLSFVEVFRNPVFYLAYITNTMLGYNAAWYIGQRYYSVPTERDARKVAVLAGILSLVLPLLWIAPTMAARLLFPDMGTLWPELSDPAEASFVTLALVLLPNGLIGISISAILAATMSSVDTQINYVASILVKDVYIRARRSIIGEVPSERRQLRMGRITAFVLGISAIGTALVVQRTHGVFEFALMYYSWFAPSLLTPVMLGFVYTKTPSWSGIASVSAGLLVVLFANVVLDVSAYQYQVNVFGGVLSSGLVFWISSFWRDRNPAAIQRLEAFRYDMKIPVVQTGKVLDRNALNSYRIVGWLTAIIGAVLMILYIFPASIEVHRLNLVVGIGTTIVGLWMLYYFRRLTQQSKSDQ